MTWRRWRRQPAYDHTDVLATCPACGTIKTAAGAVTLVVYASTGRADYRIRCPQCAAVILKPACPAIYHALTAARCPTVTIGHPAELDEPHPTGEPFTGADIWNFRRQLQDGVTP